MFTHHALKQSKSKNCPPSFGRENMSRVLIENVRDMANTLAKIMVICGLHYCQAKYTIETTIDAFLYSERLSFYCDKTPKKVILKKELLYNLKKNCLVNSEEAHLVCSIIARGFKAFNYEPKKGNHQEPGIPEWVYEHAAKKTAADFACFAGLYAAEQRNCEHQIKKLYKEFFDRFQQRKTKTCSEDAKCYICGKIWGPPAVKKRPSCESKKNSLKFICPNCCRKLKGEKRVKKKPKPCKSSLKPCVCEEEPVRPTWVKSICDQLDMSLLDSKTGTEREGSPSGSVPNDNDPCSEWHDPTFLKAMSDPNNAAEPTAAPADCSDWFDPEFLKAMK